LAYSSHANYGGAAVLTLLPGCVDLSSLGR
jgi:hypothetical protein